MAEEEPRSEQEVIRRFSNMRSEVQAIWTKLNDLTSESQEHDLVIKALTPMDPKRACHRLIGDVLVERNVEETLPAVQRNKASIDAAIATLSTQFEARKKELAEFQTKYKIRLQGQDEEERGRPGPGNSAGVLVSNS